MIFSSSFVSAQETTLDNFSYWLKEVNAEFNLPKGFKEMDNDGPFPSLPRGKLISGQVYRIGNSKGSTISIEVN
ncbi:hypothetical protein EZJ43_12895 [Pedobacter changchengzhani]|uniref:Uncharacterized protein n=2 Tax=Pedobacter changchengzhani TaxID=2529274 RepID=A0A4R5MJY4_9SPHI|nr:hypothetical protein EZJ43_12895 [Pedobacter changchengzhani]